jgi:tRNA threonylcarbamoyladenosine biosynthesis protein TsaB
VAPVSSLAAVAAQVLLTSPREVKEVLVCNDARMHEVYWAAYAISDLNLASLTPLTAEHVSLPDAIVLPPGITDVAGNGLARFPALRLRFEQVGLRVHDGLYPHAAAIARLGAEVLRRGEGVDAADALPTYVRDDVVRPAGGPVTTVS